MSHFDPSPQNPNIPTHVPPVPSIEHWKRDQYCPVTGGNFRKSVPLACDMLRSVAWKFSKTLGKMLGSFCSQIGSQNATNIGGMFHGLPSRPCRGSSEEIFSPIPVEFWLDDWCLPCLQDAMENSTLKLMFVYPLSALPTKLHGEHYVQAYDCFPFVLLCEFGLLLLTCATPV